MYMQYAGSILEESNNILRINNSASSW